MRLEYSQPPPTTKPARSPRDNSSQPNSQPPVLRPFLRPVSHFDIYVDDYLMAIQGNKKARLVHLRKLLHSINGVFRPLDDQDATTRQHVPSLKKLLKGDASVSYTHLTLPTICSV